MSPTSGETRPPNAVRSEPLNAGCRWWALAVFGVAQLMVTLDATIVNIAIPSAQRELGFDSDMRQWIVSAYSLTFGSLLLLGGRIADLFGRRNTFAIGIAGFTAASVLGGAANGFTMLVLARAVQGVFAALLAPGALSLLTTTFTDPKERGRAFGVYGAISISGLAVGHLLGGVLTEYLSWRWTLYVNVIFGAVALLGAIAFVRRDSPGRRPQLDLPGTVLTATGLFGIVFGFANAESYGWAHPMCWMVIAAGAALLAVFVFWQARATSPLLPLRILRDRDRAASLLAAFTASAGMFAVTLFLTYYLQNSMYYTPLQTGLGFLPMIGAMVLTSQISAPVLAPRVGAKPLVPSGMAVTALGLVWLTTLDLDSNYSTHLMPALVVIGIGFGLALPVAIQFATAGVVSSDQGAASAAVTAMQQIGGSVGIALLNTIAAITAEEYLAHHLEAAPQAALHSYAVSYWWAAGLFAAGAVAALLLYRAGRPRGYTKNVIHTG